MKLIFWSTSILLHALGSLALPKGLSEEGPTTPALTNSPLGYAAENGGTTGGKGGATVTVTSFDELQAAVKGDEPKIVIITGKIEKEGKVRVGSNKTILGKDQNAALIGIGLSINKVKNVIVRNLKISKVKADQGDAIGIQLATNVWIDHMDLSSDLDHDKDYYDGLLDITHAGDFITVSYTHFHDHFKASLVGHSDNNAKEDKGHLRVTYHNNKWTNINSRTPSFRFGTGHIFNSLFENVKDGINTRQGAQVLVENNLFTNTSNPLYSTDSGYAVEKDNEYTGGKGKKTALKGTLQTAPYRVTLQPANKIRELTATAGNTLTF